MSCQIGSLYQSFSYPSDLHWQTSLTFSNEILSFPLPVLQLLHSNFPIHHPIHPTDYSIQTVLNKQETYDNPAADARKEFFHSKPSLATNLP